MSIQLHNAAYHERRRDQERIKARDAKHARARESHERLASLHDLRRVLDHLWSPLPEAERAGT